MRAVLLSLLVLLPALAVAASDPELGIETFTLPNGLHVILHEDHAVPTVAVNVWYHVGSRDERPGRTGFAHLFEHMMFQGSAHHDADYFVPLQKVGGRVNGSTNTDRTNYWEDVPADQLELALFLEADRMGWLPEAMTAEKLANQVDVVQNEKRQGDNRPYSQARRLLHEMLFPPGHPYRWLTIGSLADLEAASLDDVKAFFAEHYVPNNASLSVAGDFDPGQAKAWIEEYFGPIAPGPARERLTAWLPRLDVPRRAVAEDDVPLARLYMAWHTPAYYADGDAEFDLLGMVLAGDKTGRLVRRLVLEEEIAQDVSARQLSRQLGSVFEIRATAAPGRTLAEVEAAIDEELARLLDEGIARSEADPALAVTEADFVRSLQRLGGFGGRADRLNRYHVFAGDADYLARDLARFRNASPASITAAARRYLQRDARAVLHVVPRGDHAATDDAADRTDLPPAGAPVKFDPPRIATAAMANGLQVCVVTDRDLPLVEVRLNLLSGWAADPAGRAGTAALTADLLDEGIKGKGAVDLARAVAKLGADLDTRSSFDASEVSLNVLRGKLIPGLDLLRDVVRRPSLAAADFARLKRAYAGRQAQEARRPRTQAITTFQLRTYGGGHPYAQPYTGSGTAESLAALSLPDIKRFHTDHYRPDNAVLVFTGDVELAEAMDMTADIFGDWQPGAVASPPPPPVRPDSGAPILVLDRPGAPQSVIVGGHAGLPRDHEDHLALSVVNDAFGGQFTSRINLNLREDKGYTYGVRSNLMSLRHGGMFLMVAPVETGVTAAAMSELAAEYRDLCGPRPLAGRELADGRSRLVKGFPAAFGTLGAVAEGVGELVRNGLPLDTWQTRAGRIAGVDDATAAAVVARHLDPARLRWVVVGDAARIVPEIEAAGLGAVEIRAEN